MANNLWFDHRYNIIILLSIARIPSVDNRILSQNLYLNGIENLTKPQVMYILAVS